MLKITAINVQEKKKDRCNIFVDGEFYVALSLEIVMNNRLKSGQEIDKKALDEIVFEGQKSDALKLAINYVSKALKTKKQVRTYLLGKGYSDKIAWFVVDKLVEYKYIDDAEYAKRYIEGNSRTQGKRLIEYKLMMKGLKKEDVSNIYEDADVNDKENAYNLAQKHLKNKEITKENLAKTYRYLIGRGFSYEQASYAISKFGDSD